MVKKTLTKLGILGLVATLGVGCVGKQPMVQHNEYKARTLKLVNEFKVALELNTETIMYSRYKNSTSSRIVTACFVDLDDNGKKGDLLISIWYEDEPFNLGYMFFGIGRDEEVVLVDGGKNGYGSVDYARYKLERGGSKTFDVRKKEMPIANELYQMVIDQLLEEESPDNSIENLNNLIAQLESKNK